MKIFEHIKEDVIANRTNTKGIILVVSYRLTNNLYKSDSSISYPLYLLCSGLYVLLINWVMGFEVNHRASIGQGLLVYHGMCTVVNRNTVIGNNCTIRHGTTIGNKGEGKKSLVIGDRVNIGSNSIVIGQITIGNDVTIGAGSVVISNIPSGGIFAGNPAREINKH